MDIDASSKFHCLHFNGCPAINLRYQKPVRSGGIAEECIIMIDRDHATVQPSIIHGLRDDRSRHSGSGSYFEE